jgi:multiple antibiotic resistance protein
MDTIPDTFSTIAFTIFFVLNATGMIPVFLALLARFDHKRQLRIIAREMVLALVLLLLFTYFGDWILKVLGISRPIIGVAGGALLFIIALSMIFPKAENVQKLSYEPIFIPLAMPGITGPGAITTVMTYAQTTGDSNLVALAVLCAWFPSLIILLMGSYIKKLLGELGLIAIERVGGMLIALIGVNMMTTGILTLVKEYFHVVIR